MTILVDEARWEWRGARWAHLISDRSYAELHEFARGLGKRRLGFQGDHYDVDDLDRERALALGAEAIDSRELVRRLRAAGLRDRASKPRWVRRHSWPAGIAPSLEPAFHGLVAPLRVDLVVAEVAVFEDPVHRVLLLDRPPDEPAVTATHPDVIVGAPRADGWHSIEVFVSR